MEMKTGFCIYTKASKEAVALYLDAFQAELGYHVMLEGDTGYYHAEIVKDGQSIFAVSENEEWDGVATNMQFSVNFGSDQLPALEHAYQTLCKDAVVVRFPLGPCEWTAHMTDLTDRFGVRWYLAE